MCLLSEGEDCVYHLLRLDREQPSDHSPVPPSYLESSLLRDRSPPSRKPSSVQNSPYMERKTEIYSLHVYKMMYDITSWWGRVVPENSCSVSSMSMWIELHIPASYFTDSRMYTNIYIYIYLWKPMYLKEDTSMIYICRGI